MNVGRCRYKMTKVVDSIGNIWACIGKVNEASYKSSIGGSLFFIEPFSFINSKAKSMHGCERGSTSKHTSFCKEI